jgi:uncharacterized protein (DUF58 family)
MTERFFSPILKWALRKQRWLWRRFTPAGRLMLGALIAAEIVGLDTMQSMAYQAFTLIAAVLALSLMSGMFFKPRLAARRALPRFGTVNESLLYRVSVENRSDRKQEGITVLDDGDDGFSPRGSLTAAVRQFLSGGNAFFFQAALVPTIPPRETVEIPLEIVPRRRGPLRLSGLAIARDDPFGLFRAVAKQQSAESVLILPKRYPLPSLELPGTRRYHPGGVSLALSVGDSEEFISVRDYRPGDPLRRIYWRAWARTGRPIVKEYQDEYFVRHALVLDTFTTDASGRPFEEAVSVAASFASSIVTRESLLDLMFVGAEAYCFTSGRGVSQAERMLEILASVIPCADKPFETLPPLVLERAAMLSGCICVLLAWDEPRKDFIRRLRELGIPVMGIVITESGAPASPGPEFEGTVKMLNVEKIGEGLAGL